MTVRDRANSLLKNGDWLRRGPKFHSIQKHRKVPVPVFQRAAKSEGVPTPCTIAHGHLAWVAVVAFDQFVQANFDASPLHQLRSPKTGLAA
jgi:hypothetical protein